MTLVFRPVTRENRAAFEAFFSASGAPHFCWCMVWRRTAAEAKHHSGTERKAQMMQRIEGGSPVGLLAYDGEAAAAWVSVAPRETYRNLGGPSPKPGEVVWSIVCFFVPRKRRGQGIRALIAGAVEYAKGEGATVVEAYPVDRGAPSYRYMGFVDVFAASGFRDEGMAGTRRHVMRLRIDPPARGRG
ncbi:MAG TPA: GNAT family N-acetyltransferase [Bauldia sp.]|nr:GNAT family N-acetyltransferase [Bauldia sp.]